MTLQPLLWTVRIASALGFASLSMTGELSEFYIAFSWIVWLASFLLDRLPGWEQRLRSWETAAVGILITVFLLDFFYWGHPIFISVAHFLMLFQIVKLLGLKERKDCLQILLFSFFQMLSACTLSVDAWQAVILLLWIPTATAGLFWQQISRENDAFGGPPPASAYLPFRKLVMGMCLCAVPINLVLTAGMFMIFPRLAFRGAFAGVGAGRSGYNEQVNLAQTGVLSLDNSAVLWLEITPVQDRGRWKGYLRGGTLDYFDGKTWGRRRTLTVQTLSADRNGVFKVAPSWKGTQGLRQTITLVNTAGATLFGSPIIGEITAPLATLQLLSDNSARWSTGWRKPLRYEVRSFEPVSGSHNAGALNSRMAQDYLVLPNVSLKRTELLARQIAGRKKPLNQAKAIENYLRSKYTYSLDLGNRQAENPVDDFLFVHRRGPCGHFASAMAVMLRTLGIPSRVAAGYLKGTWNERVGQYLIRERDAHAWVEAYFPETGWVTFDPSPRQIVVPQTQVWRLRWQESWEYINFEWDRLVIEYDLLSQMKVAEDIQSNTQRMNARVGGWVDTYLMGSKKAIAEKQEQNTHGQWIPVFLTSTICFVSVGALYIAIKKRSSGDPAIAFYQAFLKKMARKGYPKLPSETGWEFAERLALILDPGPIRNITKRYYALRFAQRS